jgi:hypothetical protein
MTESGGDQVTGRDRAYMRGWMARHRPHASPTLAYLCYAACSFLLFTISYTLARHARDPGQPPLRPGHRS